MWLVGPSTMPLLGTSIMILLGTSIISNVYLECPLSIRQLSFLSAIESSVDRQNRKKALIKQSSPARTAPLL